MPPRLFTHGSNMSTQGTKSPRSDSSWNLRSMELSFPWTTESFLLRTKRKQPKNSLSIHGRSYWTGRAFWPFGSLLSTFVYVRHKWVTFHCHLKMFCNIVLYYLTKVYSDFCRLWIPVFSVVTLYQTRWEMFYGIHLVHNCTVYFAPLSQPIFWLAYTILPDSREWCYRETNNLLRPQIRMVLRIPQYVCLTEMKCWRAISLR